MDNIDTSELFAHYPHLAAKIQNLWGTKECRANLLHLLSDSRGGTRAGFPIEIGKTIILLLRDHDAKFPMFDDTDTFLPFIGMRPRPVIVKQQYDWSFIGTGAKLMAFILIGTIFYKFLRFF